jgi:carbamoyl-phosphate synthase small subunit
MLRNSFNGGYLLLEDGTRFYGEVFYGKASAFGEAVFNTSHSGYQEILSDPSYRRQIMVFTAAHIGNVGVNDNDRESGRVQAAGAVVRNLCDQPSNWRSQADLSSWLDSEAIPILAGADTRAITLYIRRVGAMRAGLFPDDVPVGDALEQVKASPDMLGADLASEVTCETSYEFDLSETSSPWHPAMKGGEGLRVAVFDFGVKRNILRELARRGCEVIVLPAGTPAEEVSGGGYHGVLISNGPGDPAAVTYGVDTVGKLIGKVPLFGICLGHQLLALAAGLRTFKLPFGHRGANHPVRREADRTVEITSQNHGFAVKGDALSKGWRITHVNLNDQTVEGIEHEELPVFSVQYHPEASPGPHDSLNYFDRFIEEMIHAQAR